MLVHWQEDGSMPEFYQGSSCKYQPAAQPYLDAIARGIRDSFVARQLLLRGTDFEQAYSDSDSLWLEQWKCRDPKNTMICPFWSNYCYEPCQSCDCRLDKSVSMEIDALFFLQNRLGTTIAIHVEMKRDREGLSDGQADAYRPRAKCYLEKRRVRKGVLQHDHFVTVLFCGIGTDILLANQHFDRVIFHEDARKIFVDYPAA